MGRGIGNAGRFRGGILSLVRTIEDHGRALEYDLMTRTGRTLDEYMMRAAGKVALISFIRYLPPDAELRKEMEPKNEVAEWYTRTKTNAILADLFDAFVASRTPKGKKPKEYPRPKKKRSIGKGAVSITEFWNWWNKGR